MTKAQDILDQSDGAVHALRLCANSPALHSAKYFGDTRDFEFRFTDRSLITITKNDLVLESGRGFLRKRLQS